MNATARTGLKAAFGRLREMDRAVSLTGLNPKKAAATLKLAGAEESRCAQWGKVFLRSVRWPERAFGVLAMSFHFAWMALPFTRFMYPTNWLTSALPGSE
ncbi:MAG TPA: hypothetical protein ENK11_08265, partial [Phycisphaerales bacterium]|nr:hypothetical protein [Phycisphaerales bacterium]